LTPKTENSQLVHDAELSHTREAARTNARSQTGQKTSKKLKVVSASKPNTKSESFEAPIVAKPSQRISRDEMNLAEFPLTVLSTRSNPRIKTLEFSDSIRGPAGKPIKREWIITGADKFGLPTSSDDEVLLGLLKLTVDGGLSSAKVYFTRYELLRILNWTTEGRSYTRLQNALDRLSGVRIKATNAFYDNETKSFSTKNFGVVDAYEVNDGRDNGNKPSFFIWSDELFRSFQVGFIKKFDLDFYLHLNSAVAKRLYRYLDKLFWYKQRVQFNLFVLCHEKIGVSRNFKYASSLKQQLEPGLEELVKANFISSFEFVGRGKLTEVVVVSANQPRSPEVVASRGLAEKTGIADALEVHSDKPREADSWPATPMGDRSHSFRDRPEEPTKSPSRQTEISVTGSERERLMGALAERGLQDAQCRRLTASVSDDDLAYSFAIVAHFDDLIRIGSPKVSLSPIGFLYSAIKKGRDFKVPSSKMAKGVTSAAQTTTKAGESRRGTSAQQLRANREEIDALQVVFAQQRAVEIAKRIDSIDPSKVDRLRVEVDNQLRSIRSALGEDSYLRTREGIVEDRIAELLDLDTFDDWLREQRK
jgi:hypothetical protein